MREIKFRAWIDDAALCNEEEIVNHLDKDGEFIPFMQNLEYWYFDEGQTLGDYLANFGKGNVMQYTGLKHRDGAEIYEGDILEYSLDDMSGDIGVVEMSGDGFWIVKMEHLGDFDPLCDWLDGNAEIVGNIYGNPELLSKEV